MNRKPFGSVRVKDVDLSRILEGKAGPCPMGPIRVGVDVGKLWLFAVVRWFDGSFERPWKIANPSELVDFVSLLRQLHGGHERGSERGSESRAVTVALESSGTYGDALRQALSDAGIEVHRVSGKAAHDYAEIFDGVPSQHDGKDAAVVAELSALGKSVPWPYQATEAWDQELRYWVDWMTSQRRVLAMWQGRLEGVLARHWPEATRVLKLSSVTLLKMLAHYGSPQALGSDPEAPSRLTRWGGRYLEASKIERIVSEAKRSGGVRAGPWEVRRVQEFARQAIEARRQGRLGERHLRRLARGQCVLEAQGKAVGVPTACVLWACTGDPRKYHAAEAYRKAMGLNLVEHSSGEHQGERHISKRGSSCTRQWLYFAVLRLVQKAGVRGWYEAKKARDPKGAKGTLVALMRKLALALHRIGVAEQAFDVRRLFAKVVRRTTPGGLTPGGLQEAGQAEAEEDVERAGRPTLVTGRSCSGSRPRDPLRSANGQ